MGNHSDSREFQFKLPDGKEFRAIFLKYAILPYGILLILLPAYFQFKTLLVFTPLIGITLIQAIIYISIKARFRLYITSVMIDNDGSTLHIEWIDNGFKKEQTLAFKSYNFKTCIRTNQIRAFSYFDLFDSGTHKKILRQYLIGEWTEEAANSVFQSTASSSKTQINTHTGF